MDMYLICIGKRRGVDILTFPLLAEGVNVAEHVKIQPGVGKPWYIVTGFPDGQPSGVNFADAPIVSSDASVNQANMEALLASPPWDAFSYS